MLLPLGAPTGETCRILRTPDRRYYLVVRDGDETVVLDGVCPHVDAPMYHSSARRGQVMCTLHFWRFDLTTGAGLTDGRWPLRRYPVVEVDGALFAEVPDVGDPAGVQGMAATEALGSHGAASTTRTARTA